MSFIDILKTSAEQAVDEHTRLVLLAVLIVIQQARDKEHAIELIQDFLLTITPRK